MIATNKPKERASDGIFSPPGMNPCPFKLCLLVIIFLTIYEPQLPVGWTSAAHPPFAGHSSARWADAKPNLQVSAHRSEEHTSELQSRGHLVCRLLLDKKNTQK